KRLSNQQARDLHDRGAEMRMRMFAAAIAMCGFGVSVAEAMPIAPVNGIAAKNTVLVDYACGRGYHLTRWGNCRPNWNRPPPPGSRGANGPPQVGMGRPAALRLALRAILRMGSPAAVGARTRLAIIAQLELRKTQSPAPPGLCFIRLTKLRFFGIAAIRCD